MNKIWRMLSVLAMFLVLLSVDFLLIRLCAVAMLDGLLQALLVAISNGVIVFVIVRMTKKRKKQ